MLRSLLLASIVACSLGAAPSVRRPRFDGRINGGKPVDIDELPYQLSFEYSNSHICGAAIISANWVVTAAQCADGVSASLAQFRAGSSERGTGGSIHPAALLIIDPRYDYYTIDFDIAVARVSVVFTFGPGVLPIPLAVSDPAAGEIGVVSGWGAVSSGSSSLPSQLHAVKVVIVSREQCNVAYSGYGGITDRMVCATGGDVCQGDSGGPLAVNGILVGVVSWVGGCAEASYPGVYSSIASLRDFITEQTGVN